MAKIPSGVICNEITFNEITNEGIFTGAGTAKKDVVNILQSIKKIYNKMYFDKTGKSATTISDLTVDNLWKVQRELIVLRGITEAWIGERNNDLDRQKRAYGFEAFEKHLDGLLTILSTTIKQKDTSVTDEKIGEEALKVADDDRLVEVRKHYANRSANSVLTKIAPALNLLAPSANTAGKLNAKVEIPLEPSGIAFLGGSLTISAERGAADFKTRAQLDLIGGAKSGIFKVTGKLGGYIESKGKDAAQSLKLMSYGLHKRFRDTSWLSPFADWAWGGAENAEKFRTGVEAEAFGIEPGTVDDAYVELGGVAEVLGEVGTGPLKADAAIKGNIGKKYDKTTKGANKGKVVSGFGISGNVTLGPVGGGFSYDRGYTGTKLTKSELAFKVNASAPGLVEAVKIKHKIEEIIASVDTANKKKTDPNVQIMSDQAKAIATSGVQSTIEKSLGVIGTSGVELAFIFNFITKKLKIKFSSTTKKALDVELLSMSATSSKQEFVKEISFA